MTQQSLGTQRRTGHINGRAVDTDDSFVVLDPATGRPLADVAACGAEQVDQAVTAARLAYESGWKRTSAAERATMLRKISAAIVANGQELARIESQDTGKPLRQAVVDVNFAARFFEFYSNMVEAVFGSIIPAGTDRVTFSIREPYGVTGHITPWNYPLGLATRTIAPSLAAGNCCVLKPAEEAPLSTLRLAEIMSDAGLPDGVLNVVPGRGPEAGAALAAHPGLGKLSFTGSVPVGIRIGQATAANLVPADLELGGKSPNIVFGDADLAAASKVVAQSILQNAGQTCSAGSRLLVHRSVHQELVERLVRIFADTTLGHGLDDPGLGPVISRKQQQRVLDYIALGRGEGELLVGGGAPGDPALEGGNFILPTIFDGVSSAASIAQQEIFGPVLTVTTFDDTDEAVSLANGTDYGLVAGVWTANVGRAHRLIRDLNCGQVMVNTFSNGVELPFSGRKQSGYGTSKSYEALLGFTQTKGAVIMMSEQ
ncbi:aldehyde dehydrogenase family protein [Paenarthrobacter sp. NPDC090520]|uniref:aldehyde dehydrogenase family protein n=1 Tax=Paenarthrobacter sp. NPDC090520 TaxID=3364382 RepID=UPI00382D1401